MPGVSEARRVGLSRPEGGEKQALFEPTELQPRYMASRERLERMSTDELIETLRRFGHPVDRESLERITDGAIQRITIARNPTEAMMRAQQDLIQRTLRRQIDLELKRLVRRTELRAQGLLERAARDVQAIWIAVMDKNTCPDCIERHGQENTMEDWEHEGLPGSDNLICDGRCRCYLAPVEMFRGEPEDKGDIEGNIEVSITMETTRD